MKYGIIVTFFLLIICGVIYFLPSLVALSISFPAPREEVLAAYKIKEDPVGSGGTLSSPFEIYSLGLSRRLVINYRHVAINDPRIEIVAIKVIYGKGARQK